MTRSCLAAVLFATASLATCAQAQDPANIVVNPGFETGDFTGWTQGGDTSNSGVSRAFANSGRYSAFFGNPAAGSLSQDVGTGAGGTYDLSFFLALPVSDRPPGAQPAALGGAHRVPGVLRGHAGL